MAEPRFELAWRLELEHAEAEQLGRALAPETDEHASLDVQPERLAVDGEGSAGESLHTLDDVLSCLTGALDVLEGTGDEGSR